MSPTGDMTNGKEPGPLLPHGPLHLEMSANMQHAIRGNKIAPYLDSECQARIAQLL